MFSLLLLIADLCNAMVEDIKAAKSLMGTAYRNQALILRYEDLVRDVENSVESIYE